MMVRVPITATSPAVCVYCATVANDRRFATETASFVMTLLSSPAGDAMRTSGRTASIQGSGG